MNEDNQKYKNYVDDIRRIDIPKIRRLERAFMTAKTIAITGATLGASALVLGGLLWWRIYDRGGC